MYRALLWPATPLVAAWLGASAVRRPQLRRFRPPAPPDLGERPLWIHACSVGEVTAALPFLRAMQTRWPERGLLLTASTRTGHALARDCAPVPVTWFPLDHPLSVAGFFSRMRPAALLLVETELWPGVLAQAHASGVPVAVVSGRLSDAHARAYARSRGLWGAVLRPIAAAAMQSQAYADRMTSLGMDQHRIRVTGNIKYDATPATLSEHDRVQLRASLGIAPGSPVVVFGSTHPGDEALAAVCWKGLRDRFPGLRVIVAPRHLDRIEDARRAIGPAPLVLRSAIPESAGADASVILLDTHGELGRVYGIADVAVVCGSIHPGVNGHNPLEPAAQGVATVFGPHMGNFTDIAAQLLEYGAALQVSGPDAVVAAIAMLLGNPEKAAQVGSAAIGAVRVNQGAIDRTLEFIAPAIGLRDQGS